MLADDWGVPRCEADERGGVVLACLVKRPRSACGTVISDRAVAEIFIQTFRPRQLPLDGRGQWKGPV